MIGNEEKGRREEENGERGGGGLVSRNTLSLFSWVVQPLGPEISRIHHLNWILVSSGTYM